MGRHRHTDTDTDTQTHTDTVGSNAKLQTHRWCLPRHLKSAVDSSSSAAAGQRGLAGEGQLYLEYVTEREGFYTISVSNLSTYLSVVEQGASL